MVDPLADLQVDIRRLVLHLRRAGIPSKMTAAVRTKSLRTPRRQTGRVDRRTNREPRWAVRPDHPDYATEPDSYLVLLRLLIDLARMHGAPVTDSDYLNELAGKYFGEPAATDVTRDPLTDEPLEYSELADEILNPMHGYSRFHIGHQNPRLVPKHRSGNVRWQLKTSNDFQGTMEIRVARIAYRTDLLARRPDPRLAAEVTAALQQLIDDLDLEAAP